MFLKDADVKDLYVIGNKDAQKLHVRNWEFRRRISAIRERKMPLHGL